MAEGPRFGAVAIWTMEKEASGQTHPLLSLDSDEVSSLQPQMPGALPWAAIATLGTAWEWGGGELRTS